MIYMKFVSTTFKYYFKNFFRLLLVFLPATAFYVALVNPSTKVKFIMSINSASIENFGEVLKVFYPQGFMSILYVILFAIIFGLTLAVFTSMNEYYMRTGSHNVKESLRQTPSYFLPCLIISFMLLLASVIINFCFAAICYFAYKLIVVDKAIKISAVLVVTIFYILTNLVYIIIAAYLLYTANHIMLTKSTLLESLGLASLNFDKKFFVYICSFCFPIIIIAPLYIFTPNTWWGTIIFGIGFILAFMYETTLNLTTFFTLNNIERKDITKYPFQYFK